MASRTQTTTAIAGAGLTGSLIALELAEKGHEVTLFEAGAAPLAAASRVNEGKIHLGFVYAGDPSLRTARRMIEGAIRFRSLLERWLPSRRFEDTVTEPFDYIVPATSQRGPEEIRRHFTQVAALWRDAETATGLSYLGQGTARHWHEIPGSDPTDRIAARFRTGERSVDTALIANEIAAILSGHPRITLLTGHRVLRFRAHGAGWQAETETRPGTDPRHHGPFETVVNAAWNGRHAIDIASGFAEPGPWFTRYKCGVDVTGPARAAPPAPNVTALIGAYGDYVAFPSGRHYLSWYPSGRLLATDETDPPAPDLTPELRMRILAESFAGLESLVPSLAALRDHARPEHVDGGFIVARGASDITDRQSGLHSRHQVGIREPAPGYFSVDTGKYTLAPLLAADCAARLCGQAAPAAEHMAG